MSKHTPGPWEIVKVSDGRLRITDCNPREGDLVVELLRLHNITTQNTKTELANARLIAAAPDLMERARNVRQYIGKLAADHDGDFLGRSASGALRKLQAAIDKAEAVKS